jgi:hypothetical protein
MNTLSIILHFITRVAKSWLLCRPAATNDHIGIRLCISSVVPELDSILCCMEYQMEYLTLWVSALKVSRGKPGCSTACTEVVAEVAAGALRFAKGAEGPCLQPYCT